VVYAATASPKEAVAKACEMAFHHNLIVCHVDVSGMDEHHAREDDAEPEQPR
jgi:hypothetical protein